MSDEPLSRLAMIQPGPGLAEIAYRQLRELIVTGAIRPGTKITAPDIARRLGISRTPALEALTKLERDGLVEIQRRRGAVVVAGSYRDMRDLFDLREVLSGLAASLCARRMTPEQKGTLHVLIAEQSAALASRDGDRFNTAVADFHAMLRDGADNPHLSLGISLFGDRLNLFMRARAQESSPFTREVIEHHREIADAIDAGDPDRAEKAARAHVRHVRDVVLEPLHADAETRRSGNDPTSV